MIMFVGEHRGDGGLVLGKIGNSGIVVVIAALNEEKGIGPTISEVRDILGDACFLVVDGRSVDRTVDVAKGFGADVCTQRGRGKGQAISEAVEHISRVNGNPSYVVFIDADYTYPAAYVPAMIKILESDPSIGMVIGNRFNGNYNVGNSMRNVYYFGNRLLALAHRLASGVNIEDPLSGLRVARWSLLKDWKVKSMGFDVEAELNFYIAKRGYRIIEVPIEYRPRIGEKKLKLKHGFTILRRIVSEALF
ncbi:glycosyltransferase [Candidatus Bathyarchaeota archaeon]|nr:glycosyltransferase [Candidatus Bathyarchaeota archaeon]